MRVLVTGATGFLGGSIVAALKKHALRCIVRTAPLSFPANVELVRGDVTDRVSVGKAVAGVDVVVHAAAAVRGAPSDYERVNVEGTRNLVEAARRARVRHFVFISSILAAYENTTDYGRSKLAAERIVEASGIPFTVLRLSVVYRPLDTKTIGKMVSLVRAFPVVPLVGSGRQLLQPVYAGDVASAIAAAVESRPKSASYFIAGPPVSFGEMVASIASFLGKRRLFVPVPVPLLRLALWLPFPFTRSQLDFLAAGKTFSFGAASRDLKFRPVPFDEGLRLCFRKL